MGDGLNGTGTILYGIDLRDGSEVCRAHVQAIGEEDIAVAIYNNT